MHFTERGLNSAQTPAFKKPDTASGLIAGLSLECGMWRMWGEGVGGWTGDCTHCKEIRQVVSWVCKQGFGGQPSSGIWRRGVQERRSVRAVHKRLRHGFLCVFPVCLMWSSGPGPVSCVWWVPGPGPRHKDNTPWESTNVSNRPGSRYTHQDSFTGFHIQAQSPKVYKMSLFRGRAFSVSLCRTLSYRWWADLCLEGSIQLGVLLYINTRNCGIIIWQL